MFAVVKFLEVSDMLSVVTSRSCLSHRRRRAGKDFAPGGCNLILKEKLSAGMGRDSELVS
jgi:hypothetical protein